MTIKFISIPAKRLAQSILSTDSSFQLNNIEGWDGVNLAQASFGTDVFCAFMNSTKTQIEFMKINPATIASTSITITLRGLQYDGDLTTEVTANKFDWTANETFVMLGTDTPQMLQWLKEYIDGVAIAGAPDASTTTKGIVELATQAEADAGTATGGTGAALVVTPDKTRGKLINDYAVDSVGTDLYAITITPAITAYVAGQRFTFKAGTANTGACSLNVSGLGAKTIKKEVSLDLNTGDILANQIVEVEYDGTNMQLLSKTPDIPVIPVITKYDTVSTEIGSSTTQFDITEPVADTIRYTWDGTGTDPNITSVTVPTGSSVVLYGQNFNAANKGIFLVTGSGTNYIEVTNASGVAENNKTLGTGYIAVGNTTWTKPSGLKYIIVEVQAPGGNGGGAGSANDEIGAGGGSGGYAKKMIAASALSSTMAVIVGGVNTSETFAIQKLSGFGSSIYTIGGGVGVDIGNVGGTAGTANGGDLNINGQPGMYGSNTSVGDDMNGMGGGASSVLGLGATSIGRDTSSEQVGGAASGYGAGGGGAINTNNAANPTAGGAGTQGVVIVTEYYS